MSIKRALFWTGFWVLIAFITSVIIYFFGNDIYSLKIFSHYAPKNFMEIDGFGSKKALEFITGFILEKALSVDNLFVMLIIFTYFKITPKYQRRLLNFGIIGVIILRGIFIILGSAIVEEFHWVLYIFGFFLFYAAYHIIFGKEKEIDPEQNIVLRLFKKVFPVDTNAISSHNFFVRRNGKLLATPLLVVLIVIETSDVIFAIDSIPAIFAITVDPFIVFSSNLLAILGLRTLYFLLERIQRIFKFVKYGVGVVLAFAGVKMFIHVSIGLSLTIIIVIFAASVLLSIYKKNID